MLDNFHLAAIVNDRRKTSLMHIPLHQELQQALAESWELQYLRFVDGIEEIDFDAGYRLEADERFRLPNYELPSWLAGENSQTIENLESIVNNDEFIESITGAVAMARSALGVEVVLFQNFTRSKVIKPGRFLLFDGSTYKSTERRGLTLDEELSAFYHPEDRKLLFRNFRTVNSFLPLSDFYQEASEQEIRKVLDHEMFAVENPDALATNASQWFRTRFAMLRDSGVLDDFSAADIQTRSVGHKVTVEIVDGKMVFPTSRTAAKKLLQFLNEELYRGAITETIYETNSKKEAV